MDVAYSWRVSEIVKMKKELAELQAEEVRKDEARERRNAVLREKGEIEAEINQRWGQVGHCRLLYSPGSSIVSAQPRVAVS